MHSRIYQISINPIHKYDYIDESNYYDHWFTNSVADYVNGDTDRADDIEWLKSCYDNSGLSFGADENGEYFIVEDKTKYFADKLETFQANLKELSAITLDDFAISKYDMQMYRLKEAYEDKYGFYVDDDGGWGMNTLDACIRYSENGTKYYIGATIDYHF